MNMRKGIFGEEQHIVGDGKRKFKRIVSSVW